MKIKIIWRINTGFFVALVCAVIWICPFCSATIPEDETPDVDWITTRHPKETDLEIKKDRLAQYIDEIEQAGLDASYARSTLMLAKDFVVYASDDEKNGRPKRAAYVRGYLDEALDEAIAEAQALLNDPQRNRPIPKPQLRDITIKNGAFFAGDTQVMFGGFGHFGKVRADIPKFPEYGFNLIQIELGPSSVVFGPNPQDIRTDAIINEVVKYLDLAEKHNIMINLQLSPHYFPGWAMGAYHQIKGCENGDIRFCVSDTNARNVIRRFLEVIIPLVKDKPALHSYTLANEPRFDERPYVMPHFREFLLKKYGSISRLNRAWHKNFSDFEHVQIGDDMLTITPAARYDWSVFHNEVGTDFFRWMKDVIRTMDKQTPVHIKFMSNMIPVQKVSSLAYKKE
ncbi:MAG: beta-galactosidase [bacterium]